MKAKFIFFLFFFVFGIFTNSEASEGEAYVDFTYQSTTKMITITGEAATLLYHTLTLNPGPFGKAKEGKNIFCRVQPWGAPNEREQYECILYIDEKGAALINRNH